MPSSPEPDRWQFEKVGLGYHCWSDEIQTHFRLTRIKRSHGDLTGELKIETNMKGVKTRDGVLHVARLNVLSSSSRASLARMLEKRTEDFDMDWFDGLEWLCQSVILAEQETEPVVELVEMKIEPRSRFLVEPLVLKELPSLLFGPGGVGKSLIALACGLSVASGREIIPGIPPAQQGNVLYLDWETDAGTILARMQAIARGHQFDPSKGFYYRQCHRPLADDVEELAAIVDQREIIFIIVDSAAQAMGVAGEYGDANESTIRMHGALRLLRVSSQIVDHVAKSDARLKAGTATPYGSAYKTNTARNSWEVRRGPEQTGGHAVGLYHAKANDFALREPISVTLDWERDITFRSSGPLVEDRVEAWGLRVSDRLLELLEDGEHWEFKAITSAIPDVDVETIRKTLSRMVSKSAIWKDDYGRYFRPPAGAPNIRSIRRDDA